MRCCKTCRWLKVEPDAAGRRVVRKDYAYRCEWPAPPMPALPASITDRYDYRADIWSVERRPHVTGAQGRDCPVWESLAAERAA